MFKFASVVAGLGCVGAVQKRSMIFSFFYWLGRILIWLERNYNYIDATKSFHISLTEKWLIHF
ncbi:hypothetical protein FOI67_04155 [Geobacillus sp. LEMMJ02]|nr:hypothetical protein FOI67_04155 [Geobacillus sp. LEMMJ02]